MSVPGLTWKYLNDLWRLRDRRMDGYPLMDGPLETILLTSTYILIVKGKKSSITLLKVQKFLQGFNFLVCSYLAVAPLLIFELN